MNHHELPEAELEPLLLDPAGPSVVAIGGGHGQAAALDAIQLYAGKVTAVVSVADDGGSSGRLTETMGIPAPGDIRRCLLALAPEPSLVAELFAHRFQTGDVNDHSLGNLMLAALADLTGDFGAAVAAAGRMLGAVGDVVPTTTTPVGLTARVGGQVVAGQATISKTRGVDSIGLDPADVVAFPGALSAIAEADQIVIGPGSLFTSVVAALLVPGMAEAVMSAPAEKVFVANLVTQDGETWDLDGAGHVDALIRHGRVDGPGIVVVHDGPLDVPPGLQPVRFDDDLVGSWEIQRADIADPRVDWPAHDPIALGRALSRLVG